MTPIRPGTVAIELVLGLAIAFGFAIVIRFIPDAWLLEAMPRALLYAVQVPAGIIFVFVARALAPLLKDSPRQTLVWMSAGALAFDGLVLGFWPALYGHTGLAYAIVASLLLWAFAWILIAGMLFASDTVPAK